jgi:formate hydrogenlyase subunit 6/NADH:ubiquinone oxidoreductase subunit I
MTPGHAKSEVQNQKSYWGNIVHAFASLNKGLALTFSHLIKSGQKRNTKARINIQDPNYFQAQLGIATIQYPYEQLPVPVTGRYKLHNEIDDCIVCDKCVKVCPVDCITIEPIRSPEEFGKTSDGTPKRIHAAKFDIDMGKCCFCGLCTTVCPTECLTMTPEFDFSSYSMDNHYFKFGIMTEVESQLKKKEWAEYLEAKQKTQSSTEASIPVAPKVVFKPKMNITKPGPATHE